MKTLTQNLTKVVVLFGIVGAVFAANYLMAAWTNPPASPPSNNAETPVNVGGTTQLKNGNFGVTDMFIWGNGYLPSGKLGIGTQVPTDVVHIVGKALQPSANPHLRIQHSGNPGQAGIIFQSAGSGASTYNITSGDATYSNGSGLHFERSGVNQMTLETNGNLGIGTTDPSNKLEVAGKVEADQYCDRNGANCMTPSGASSVPPGTVCGNRGISCNDSSRTYDTAFSGSASSDNVSCNGNVITGTCSSWTLTVTGCPAGYSGRKQYVGDRSGHNMYSAFCVKN